MAVGSMRLRLHGSAPLLSCIRNGSVPLRRQHCADAGIARRSFGAEVSPCVQIGHRVDDAGPDLPVGGTGPVNAMFFQSARRKAKESRCLGCPQVPWRQTGVRIGHLRGSMVVWYASAITGGSAGTMEEENVKPGWRRLGGEFSIPRQADYFFRG